MCVFYLFFREVLTIFHARYPVSTYGSQSYKVFAVPLALTLIDTLGVLRRLLTFICNPKHYTLKGVVRALWGRENCELGVGPEYIALISEAPESTESPKQNRQSFNDPHSHHAAERRGNHLRTYSNISDGTIPRSVTPNSEAIQYDIQSPPHISLPDWSGRVFDNRTGAGFGRVRYVSVRNCCLHRSVY